MPSKTAGASPPLRGTGDNAAAAPLRPPSTSPAPLRRATQAGNHVEGDVPQVDTAAPSPASPTRPTRVARDRPASGASPASHRHNSHDANEREEEELARLRYKREAQREADAAAAALQRSAKQRRRVIPTPPHRQLFLVDGLYCGADPLHPPDRDPTNVTARRSLLSPDSTRGGGGPDSTAALSNRTPHAALGASSSGGGGGGGGGARMPFYVSPTAPSGTHLFSAITAAQSGANDAEADTAQGGAAPHGPAEKGSRRRAQRRPERLKVKQRFYEPVELQVESISAFAMRVTLVLWYTCLVAALIIEVIPQVQWSMENICGADYAVDMRFVSKFSSPCVTTEPALNASVGTSSDLVTLRWSGNQFQHQRSRLVRFRRLVFSLPVPASQTASVQEYDLLAVSQLTDTDGVQYASEYPFTLRCDTRNVRCDTARVPEQLLGGAPPLSMLVSFAVTSVPAPLATDAASGAVSLAYQRSTYTVATVVWRYVLIFLSLLHTLRFIAYRKYTSTLYEQSWLLILQLALLWYLDPLFALNIVSWPMPSVLSFLEYRLPTYFVAILIAYMLSVMTASMAWSRPREAQPGDSCATRLAAFLLRSRNVYDPPMWTKLFTFLYVMCIFVLDIADACADSFNWFLAADSETRFSHLFWAVIALHLAGAVLSLALLMYLRGYLGSKPYLESRPQQLACRVFLMVFLSAIVYYVIHCLVFFLLYNREYPALASQQPFLQLPTLMVASFFVNIMTLVYTSQNRDESVPIHPKDPRWKHMVWPDTWYRWLARHGGSQYIFATEVEETRFYRLQFEFRRRQFMAKQKRRHSTSGVLGGLVPSLAGSMAVPQGESALGANMGGSVRSPTLGDSHMTTAGGFSSAMWRTDVWETPHPSRPASESEQENENTTFNRSRATDELGSTGRGNSGSGGGAEQRQHGPSPDDADAGAASGLGQTARRNTSFRRARDDVGLQDVTPVNLAARHIMNMDRFSTYFLADGDGTAAGGGAAAASGRTPPTDSLAAGGAAGSGRERSPARANTESGSGFAREASVAPHDLYAIEGPAHRRSRLQQSFTASRYGGRANGAPTLQEAALSSKAMTSTFSGFDRVDRHHHARSRSDGDVDAVHGSGDGARRADARGRGAGRYGAPVHRDPAAGLGRPEREDGAEEDASVFPLPDAKAAIAAAKNANGGRRDRVNGKDGGAAAGDDDADERARLEESGAATSSHNDSFARQRDHLLRAMRQLQGAPSSSRPLSPMRPLEQSRNGYSARDSPPGLPRLAPVPTSVLLTPASSFDATLRRPPLLSPARRRGAGRGGPAHTHSEPPHRRVHQHDDALSDLSTSSHSDTDSSHTNSDASGGRGRRHGNTRSFLRTLTLARERLGALMGTAERNLVEWPVRGLDRLEAHVFNAAYRPFQSVHYLPFFNLETAIDCFNMSWEAYGVEESKGDEPIETGIEVSPQNVPRTVAHGVKKVVCGCCPADVDSEDEEDEDSDAGEGAAVPPATTATAAAAGGTGRDGGEEDGAEEMQRTANAPTAMGAGHATARPQHEHQRHQQQDAHPVIVHMSGEGPPASGPPAAEGAAGGGHASAADAGAGSSTRAGRAAGGAAPSASSEHRPESGAPAPTTATVATPDPALLPINVEKYGFIRLLVAEAREVQVVMVKMDTTAPEHRGKAPRVIIGFRGTANLSNAKYDMNIHRVVWREMERTSDDEAVAEAMEAGSLFGDGSTTAAPYLGCAGCLSACVRRTTWRPTCHAGFLAIWKTLKPTVLKRLRDLLREDRSTVYRVFTTGHSLGGALASLCAYSITNMLKQVDYPIPDVTVYTYGQPRMGNRTFQRIYNRAVPRSFRIVNESDVVVTMSMFGGYHVGIEVDVDRNGNFIVKPTEIEKLFPPTKGRGLAVANHLMSNYGISLNSIASRTTCPARGLDFYKTADPAKVEAEERLANRQPAAAA